MKLIWLGHASWRLEIAGQVLLIDPWLTGNGQLAEADHERALAGATHILLTHGHFDHAIDVVELAKRLDIPVVGQYDLMGFWEENEGIKTIGFNKGGTVDLDGVAVTMVTAVHSSTIATPDGPRSAGSEAGFVISGEGHTIYHSGDTDVTMDMKIINDLHKPDIGILSVGGHFTMDMARGAYAAREFFDFKTVIPSHYRSFPFLAQDAAPLRDGLPGVAVIEPEVLTPIEF